MNSGMVAIMLAVSLLIGLIGLIAFLWGLKSGQFDDENKMTQGILFDSPHDLKEAMQKECKQASIKTSTVSKEKHGKNI